MCESNRFAGIILCSGDIAPEDIKILGVPVITVERHLEDGTASVECDNNLGGEMAAKALIDCGCRKLLCIGGVSNHAMPADDRMKGFETVCKKNGVDYQITLTSLTEYNQMNYKEELSRILTKETDIDGIFASSDIIAAQTIQVCHKLGRRIPEDMKLIGFDDVLVSSLTSPQISTIRQPIDEMAEMAVELLMKAADGKTVPKRTILGVSFIERETTGI